MAIKINIGKLEIPVGLKNIIRLSRKAGIEIIPVKNSHILYYQSPEVHPEHKDPFDRYIISTAYVKKCRFFPMLRNLICIRMSCVSGNDFKFSAAYAD